MKLLDTELIDNTYYSIGFPNKDWDNLICRDNYLLQIEDFLFQKAQIIFIDGEEDSGRTTLCAQFAKKYPDQTISVFFNTLNSIDYQIEYYCTNVVSQIRYILKENQSPDEKGNFVTVEQYRQYIFQLRKMLKNKANRMILVIDGLESKVNDDPDFIKRLFDILPIGEEFIKLIITGKQTDFSNISSKLKSQECKVIHLAGFSGLEIIKYLGLSEPLNLDMQDLLKITKGFPGRLNTLKRLIKNEGYSLNNISQTTTYTNWLDLDCEKINLDDPSTNVILSILALSEISLQLEDLSKICSLSLENTKIIIDTISVLEYSNTGLNFISKAHKKYFSNILRANKNKIDDLVIKYLASEDSIKRKYELSKYYAKKRDWLKIIELIDEEYLKNILDSTGTLEKVNESLELGVKASEEKSKFIEMWRYSIQGSIVNELDNYLFWESEINARISIDDFYGAISLANSAVLKVDRLHLLALIARKQKEFRNKVDEELINLIQDLYHVTDLTSVGNKIYDIVSDLLFAIPNLAIEMIEKSSGNVSEKNINDWVIAKLSTAAIDINNKDNGNSDRPKPLEAIESIHNPLIRKINRAISFLVGNYSAIKVLEEVKKLSDSMERLRLLRLWLNNNHSNIETVEIVIDAALDELVSLSAEETITFDILKDLSFQLPFVKNAGKKELLYKRFKLIEKDLHNLGLTKNKYIYELNIFDTELSFNKNKSILTINRIIKEVEGLNDVLTKLESFAEIYSKLIVLKHDELKSKSLFVHRRIKELSNILYTTTADHYNVSQYYLTTIAKRNPLLGLKISTQINTVIRRDKARLLILDSYLNNNLKHIKIEVLKKIETSFEHYYPKQLYYLRILERFAEAKRLHYDIIKELIYFMEKVELIENSSEKVDGYILSYRIVSKNDDWKNKIANIYERKIIASWNEIEAEWDRIDKGFIICSELAGVNQKFANTLFTEVEKIKSNTWIDSKLIAYTYLNSISLIIKAYNGLLISRNNTAKDYQIIEDLINRIPSEIEKLTLWTMIGFYAYAHNSEEVGKKILNDHILPLFAGLLNENIDLEPVLASITLIHLYNPDLSIEYSKRVSADWRDKVYANICDYYVTKRIPFEVYEQELYKYNCDYNDLTKALCALNLIQTDATMYVQIDSICKAILNNKENLSNPQINDLTDKLETLIENKLPDNINIKHQGYKLLAKAKVGKLKRSVNWESLIEESNKIPNNSDIIFVKSVLLEDIPFDKIKKGGELKQQLFDDIIRELDELKIHYEFVERVIDISDKMYNVNVGRSKWKNVINKAFTISYELDDGKEIYNAQRNIIDSVYRLDPAFARDLIKTIDCDNKKNRIARLLKDHFEALEISSKIKNNEELQERERGNYRMVVMGVSYALKALNSDMITTRKISELIKLLRIGNKLPLHEVFPIFSYYLSNCSRTYKQKLLEGTVSDLHKNNFKEAVNATNLIELLSQRRKINEKSFRNYFIDEEFATNKLFKPKTKEEAIAFIREWMRDELDEFIIIADPYFQKEDLEILKIIKEVNESIEINVLGSEDGPKYNVEEEYKNYWKKISAEIPPFTKIIFCWIPEDNNNKPIHDRWIITKNGGLRIGTSIKSIGSKRESEISVMKPNDALNIMENTLKDYIMTRKRVINNFRLSYKSFTL